MSDKKKTVKPKNNVSRMPRGRTDDDDKKTLKNDLRLWMAEALLGAHQAENLLVCGDGEIEPWPELVFSVRGADVRFYSIVDTDQRVLEPIADIDIEQFLLRQSVGVCGPYGTALGQRVGSQGFFTRHEARECLALARALAIRHKDRLLAEHPTPIAFADDDNWTTNRLPFRRPRVDGIQAESGKMDYSGLGPYFRLLLQRIEDYDEQTDQSRMFESLLECIAQLFLQSTPTKVVPFIYGPAGAAKTSLVEDIGSFFGSAFLAQQNIATISDPVSIAACEHKRLVHCDEAPKGDQLSEPFKALTGGAERVQARVLYEGYRHIRNTWMIWVTSNHPPLFARDEAAIARFRVIGLKNAIHLFPKMADADFRRDRLAQELEHAIALGASLLEQNGGMARESAREEIARRLDDELEIIQHQVSKYFEVMRGGLLPVAEVKLWAQRHKHNFKRVEMAILSMQLDDTLKIEKIRAVAPGRARGWVYRHLTAKRMVEIIVPPL